MNENNSKKILLIKSSLNKTINSEVILNSSICKLLSKKHKIIEKTNIVSHFSIGVDNIFKYDFNLDKNAYETPTVTNIESLSDVADNAPTKEDEKILDIVNKNLESDDTKIEEDILGQTFRLNKDAGLYSRYYSSTAETPLYKNDLYTTIGVLLETNYGEEIRVDYNTPDCEEIIYNVLEQGGKIIKRQAVCATGLQDFLNTGIPTGIVDENKITLVNENSELKNMIISSLNNGRSR